MSDLANIVKLCETKVPDFVLPAPPPGANRRLRNQPGDKVEYIQDTLLSSDWIVNQPNRYPFEFQRRDITPPGMNDKVYLIWAFKLHNPDVNTDVGPYKNYVDLTIEALRHIVNIRRHEINYRKFDIYAVQKALGVFMGVGELYKAASVLFLQQGKVVTPLSAVYATLHRDQPTLHIEYVGGGLEQYGDNPGLVEIYKNFTEIQSEKYPGSCQQNVSLFMAYVKDTYKIQLMGLQNAADMAGCLCYIRAATVAGLLTIRDENQWSVFKWLSDLGNKVKDIHDFVRQVNEKLFIYQSCKYDTLFTIAFITPEYLKELVKVNICIHEPSFIPVAEDIIKRKDWERLRILHNMVHIPPTLDYAMHNALKNVPNLTQYDVDQTRDKWSIRIRDIINRRNSMQPALKKARNMNDISDCDTEDVRYNLYGCPYTGARHDKCMSFCGEKWREWLPTFLSLLTNDWGVTFSYDNNYILITVGDTILYEHPKAEEEMNFTTMQETMKKLIPQLEQILTKTSPIEVYLQRSNEEYNQTSDNIWKVWDLFANGDKMDGPVKISLLQ